MSVFRSASYARLRATVGWGVGGRCPHSNANYTNSWERDPSVSVLSTRNTWPLLLHTTGVRFHPSFSIEPTHTSSQRIVWTCSIAHIRIVFINSSTRDSRLIYTPMCGLISWRFNFCEKIRWFLTSFDLINNHNLLLCNFMLSNAPGNYGHVFYAIARFFACFPFPVPLLTASAECDHVLNSKNF